MEDNVIYGTDKVDSKILATNLMLVDRAANAVKAFGNEVANSAEAREMLDMKPLDHGAVNKALDQTTIDYIEPEKEKLKELGSTYSVTKGMGGK